MYRRIQNNIYLGTDYETVLSRRGFHLRQMKLEIQLNTQGAIDLNTADAAAPGARGSRPSFSRQLLSGLHRRQISVHRAMLLPKTQSTTSRLLLLDLPYKYVSPHRCIYQYADQSHGTIQTTLSRLSYYQAI